MHWKSGKSPLPRLWLAWSATVALCSWSVTRSILYTSGDRQTDTREAHCPLFAQHRRPPSQFHVCSWLSSSQSCGSVKYAHSDSMLAASHEDAALPSSGGRAVGPCMVGVRGRGATASSWTRCVLLITTVCCRSTFDRLLNSISYASTTHADCSDLKQVRCIADDRRKRLTQEHYTYSDNFVELKYRSCLLHSQETAEVVK